MLSQDGQYVLDQYIQVLQQIKDLSPVTIRNYMSGLRLFIAWCKSFLDERQEDHFGLACASQAGH
jgi:site-specific recombinase XerC